MAKKILLFLSAFIFMISTLKAQSDYFWVGGTGNWNDLTHWVTTSGGSTQHTMLPTNSNNVYFDANSFSSTGRTVTMDVTNGYCKDMIWTGATNAPTFTSSGT